MPLLRAMLPAALLAAVANIPFALPAAHAAPNFQVLYAFTGGADGGSPRGRLLQDRQGNLYGTTFWGGNRHCACGVVFRLSPSGKETALFRFRGNDGYHPVGGLVRNKAGDLFGVTQLGGRQFEGAVFRLTPAGEESVLYSFKGNPDGSTVADGPILDREGNVYGTTEYGGIYDGIVYKIAPNGTETILHTFRDGAHDGAYAYAGVVRDRKGNLYGTTIDGGWAGDEQGPGILYQLTPAGKLVVLHHFEDYPDGGLPSAAPTMDADGNLYGTTLQGGYFQKGVVYKFATDGTYKVLHSFGGTKDGEYGIGRLIMDANGSLYGVTQGGGGACDCGVVFKLAPDGTYTVLHRFTGGSDGAEPYDGLIMDATGNLYGTASEGGLYDRGVVFRIAK